MAKEVVIPIEDVTKVPQLINLATLILGYFIVVTSGLGILNPCNINLIKKCFRYY